MTMTNALGATSASVAFAAKSLRGTVVRTPLLHSSLLDAIVSARLSVPSLRVLVKAECLQQTGAFKFRGATNRLLQLSPSERSSGVVAFSSGNFAQALALASRNEGVKCTIVAPHDAPELKLNRARDYGATVVLSTPDANENREVAASRMAKEFAKENEATLLHPFDDWDVIAGQGTLAMEVYQVKMFFFFSQSSCTWCLTNPPFIPPSTASEG